MGKAKAIVHIAHKHGKGKSREQTARDKRGSNGQFGQVLLSRNNSNPIYTNFYFIELVKYNYPQYPHRSLAMLSINLPLSTSLSTWTMQIIHIKIICINVTK